MSSFKKLRPWVVILAALAICVTAFAVIQWRSSSADATWTGTYFPPFDVLNFERDARNRIRAPEGMVLPPFEGPTNAPALILGADHTFILRNVLMKPAGGTPVPLTTNGIWKISYETQSGILTGGPALSRIPLIHLTIHNKELMRIRPQSIPNPQGPLLKLTLMPPPGGSLDGTHRIFQKAPDTMLERTAYD